MSYSCFWYSAISLFQSRLGFSFYTRCQKGDKQCQTQIHEANDYNGIAMRVYNARYCNPSLDPVLGACLMQHCNHRLKLHWLLVAVF